MHPVSCASMASTWNWKMISLTLAKLNFKLKQIKVNWIKIK